MFPTNMLVKVLGNPMVVGDEADRHIRYPVAFAEHPLV